MKEKGIEVQSMYFYGFWSQGDGASFSGHIDDFALFCKAHEFNVPVLLSFLELDDLHKSFKCYISGYYSYSGCMDFESEMFLTREEPDHPLEVAALEVQKNVAETEWAKFVDDATAAFRSHADELYKRLEEENDYLTSDEQILESLLANDGYFGETLERYESCSSEKDDEGEDAASL